MERNLPIRFGNMEGACDLDRGSVPGLMGNGRPVKLFEGSMR